MTTSVTINLGARTATDGTNTVSWSAPIIENATREFGGDNITGSSINNVIDGSSGADTIDVRGDPLTASDFVSCGGSGPVGDLVMDTVIMDVGDIVNQNCSEDRVLVPI